MRFFRGKESGHVRTGGVSHRASGFFAANQVLAEGRRPGQGQNQRSGQRNGHGDGEGTEKSPGDSGNGDKGKKDDDWRNGRADERNSQFTQGALDSQEAALPGIAVQDNIFEDHDGIVDDQANGGCKAAQSHQIETLIGHFQNDEGDEQSDRYDQPGDERSSPIAQEQDKDDRREQNADEHGIAHAGDGVVNDGGLIVKRLKVNSWGQSGGELLDERVNFVCHVQGIALGLAIHVEKYSGFTVGGHHGIDGGDRRRYFCDVAQTYGNTRRGTFDNNLPDLFRSAHLPTNEAQNKLVTVLDQARRINEIRPLDGFQNVRDSDPRS